MKRAALIIYCDKTSSGELVGPDMDNSRYRRFLTSNLGGKWESSEILSLHNPTMDDVKDAVTAHLNDNDYTFTIFTGHGCINTADQLQYIEVMDGDLSIIDLKANAPRQTIIFDSCRNYTSLDLFEKGMYVSEDSVIYGRSTRELFDRAVLRAESGLTVLYASGKNESAHTNLNGGLYLQALLTVAETWHKENRDDIELSLKEVHESASNYLKRNTDTIQSPEMTQEKRKNYFPFAVKFRSLLS